MNRTIQITGMTCAACETTVSEALCALPGVESATASARRQEVVLTGGALPSDAHIRKALASTPYGMGREAWLSKDRRAWRDVLIAAAVLGFAVIAATTLWSGPSLQDLTAKAGSGSLLVVATLGVIASLSTCAVVVGAVAVGLGASLPKDSSQGVRWGTQLAFNGGRIVGFTVLGAVMGAVGSAIALSGAAITVATLVSALVIALVGLRLTGLSPRTSGWQLTLPGRWSGWAGRPASSRVSVARVAAIGAATFILPCGFTQAVQIYAISTANPAQAAAVMGVFALGTTPGLLAIGMASAMRAKGFVARAVGVVAIGFAFVIVSGALGLGTGGPPAATPSVASANVTVVGGVQQVETIVSLQGYEPENTVVYVGEPMQWTFTPEQISCAGNMDLGQFGVGIVEALWEPDTVEFTPTSTGTFEYECLMGMYHGTLTVIERPRDA